MAYSHILFDHDGVLVDTEHLYYRATSETLATVGLEFGLLDYLSLQAEGGNAWTGMTGRGYSDRDIEAKKDERNRLYQKYLVTEEIDIPDVLDTLELLKPCFGMAIVTTAKQTDFDLIHEHREITQYMDLILTNKDYERSKPYPDPYLAALDHFGIEPQNALVVEDSERGLRSAVAAGIDCAVVHHPFTEPQDFSSATYRLSALSDLIGLLLGNNDL